MKYIDEYHSEDKLRKATIYEDKYHWIVVLCEKQKIVRTQLISGKALCYAEDCAHNFVMGYGEFKIEI
jgi:hypothetical protein